MIHKEPFDTPALVVFIVAGVLAAISYIAYNDVHSFVMGMLFISALNLMGFVVKDKRRAWARLKRDRKGQR